VTQGVSYCSAGDIAKSDFTEAYEPLLEIKYDYGKLCMSYLSMPFYGLNGAMVAAQQLERPKRTLVSQTNELF